MKKPKKINHRDKEYSKMSIPMLSGLAKNGDEVALKELLRQCRTERSK
jgi:hypothetical protein